MNYLRRWTPDLALLVIGGVIGWALSSVFEPLLKSVLYRSLGDVVVTIIIFATSFCAMFLVYRYPLHLSRKRAFEFIFLGVSIVSFFLAGLSIFTYPNTVLSENLNWVTFGRDVHFGVDGITFSLSTLVYLVARTLWSIFIGSLFAVLDRFLRILWS